MQQLGDVAFRVLDRLIADCQHERQLHRERAEMARINGRIGTATESHMIDAAAWAVRQRALEDARAAIDWGEEVLLEIARAMILKAATKRPRE